MSVKIILDKDPAYEINSFFRRLINFFLIPLLNNLPRRLFVGSSQTAEAVHKQATTHRALDLIYSFNHKLNFDKGIIDGFLTYFWQSTNNAKALRNRFKLVKKELEKAIYSLGKKEIKLLNLACGSSKAVIEVVAKHRDDFIFKVSGVDKSELAIEDSRKLSSDFKVGHLFNWHQDTISNFLKKHSNLKFDIIEMVGFLDYLEDEKAISLFDQIYSVLSDKGVFITGNIKDNPERKFLTEVVGWPHLIFRNESDLTKLFEASQFKASKIEIVYEPQKIHGVVVCKK